MAIERPKAIDDAPACGPQQREGRQAGEFLGHREEWAQPRGRNSPGGVAAQAIEAQPAFGQIEPLKRPCGSAATRQRPNRRTGDRRSLQGIRRARRNSPEFTAVPPVSPPNIADAERPHARPRQFRGLAPPAPPVAGRASTAPLPGVARTIRQHPIMDQARNRATAFRMFAHVRWKPSRRMGHTPVRCPAPADRAGPAGRQSRWRRRRRSPRRSRRSGMPRTIKIVMKASVARHSP